MMFDHRWLKAPATTAMGLVLLSASTGCASFDLKAAWALSENTPMQTVVRRADVARATVTNVDRIIGNTAVDADSKWVAALALKKSDAEPVMKDVANDPEYTSLKGGQLKVVNAEAWASLLSRVCSSEDKAPSVYATLSTDVHTGYAEIAAQSKIVAKLKADIAAEQDAIDDKDKASEKASHETKKAELEGKLDATEKEYKPKVEAFKKKLGEETAKASPEAKKQIGSVVAVLRRAVADAKVANTAALLGYPKAAPGLKDEVKLIVKRIAADTIQANIGTRPNLEKLAPEVKMSPVSVTIAGLAPSDLGKLKLETAIKDIAERSKDYVVHVVTLLPYIAETGEMLELQDQLLDEAQKGVGVVEVGEDFGDMKVTASIAPGKGTDKRVPVPMEACVAGKNATADASKADGSKADASKTDGSKADGSKADAADKAGKGSAAKGSAGKSSGAKPAATKPAAAKAPPPRKK
jgi:hypothetical protein